MSRLPFPQDTCSHVTRGLRARAMGILLVLLLAAGLGGGPWMVRAATSLPLEIRVVHVEAARFPAVETWVWVWDHQTQQVPPDLPREAFTVLEDGQPVPLQNLRTFSPGMHVVLVLNPAKSFTIRDNRGVSRYEYIFYQLRSWLETVPKGRHQISLVVAGGPQIPQSDDPAQILEGLQAYTPPREERAPSLAPLVEGLRLAQQEPPRPGMGRTVLFITAPLDEAYLNGLTALVGQAQAQNVQVSVWIVGARANAENQLPIWQTFTQQTQGQALVFSGTEVLPDLKETFARRDRLYVLEYLSQRREGGEVHLQVEVAWQNQSSRSPAFLFPLNLQPPVPVLKNLPETIVRVYARPEEKGTPEALKPTQWRLPFHVEFPDDIQRELRRAVFYVDEEPVVEITGPPFEQILWDLTPYTEPGTRTVRLEVEDAFGLVGSTPPFPVRIQIAEATPPPPVAEDLALQPNRFPWAYMLLGISGAVLVAVLLWGSWTEYRRRRGGPIPRAHPPRPTSTGPAVQPPDRVLEFLPLEREEEDAFEMHAWEVVVGSDPEQASWVLEDPSISPRHARFWYDAQERRYYVADLGSVAGTWVNYAPVSSTGLALEAGDILHIGKRGFRVMYRSPKEA